MLALATILLAGCGGGSLLPYGIGGTTELSRKPANATEYRCDGGKAFYVRNLDADAVWLIAPDREIRLNKKAEGRYVYERVELDIDKDRLDLIDPQFTSAKTAVPHTWHAAEVFLYLTDDHAQRVSPKTQRP